MVQTRQQAASAARELAEAHSRVISLDGLVCRIVPEAAIPEAAERRGRSRSPRFRRWASGVLVVQTASASSSGEGEIGDLPLGGYIARFLLR